MLTLMGIQRDPGVNERGFLGTLLKEFPIRALSPNHWVLIEGPAGVIRLGIEWNPQAISGLFRAVEAIEGFRLSLRCDGGDETRRVSLLSSSGEESMQSLEVQGVLLSSPRFRFRSPRIPVQILQYCRRSIDIHRKVLCLPEELCLRCANKIWRVRMKGQSEFEVSEQGSLQCTFAVSLGEFLISLDEALQIEPGAVLSFERQDEFSGSLLYDGRKVATARISLQSSSIQVRVEKILSAPET